MVVNYLLSNGLMDSGIKNKLKSGVKINNFNNWEN